MTRAAVRLRARLRASRTWSPERGGDRKSNFTTRALLGQLDLFDLLERFDAALHLRGLGGVRGEPIDEPLLLGEHRLLARVRRFAIGFADRALALVEVVVARVDRDLAAVDLGDPA